MSAPVLGFIKLVAMLLVPVVILTGVGYFQRGWWGAIVGGVVGFVAGSWSVWRIWQTIKIRRRMEP